GSDASRHRAALRPLRRQHLSRRAVARTIVLSSACSWLGAVPYAHSPSLHVWLGDASRRRHHGRAGTECGKDNSCRVEAVMAHEEGRVIVVGGGHNSLVAAFYIAKAGYQPLVLERRENTGGVAVTEEIYPGFRCPTLMHMVGPMSPQAMRDMRLESGGL